MACNKVFPIAHQRDRVHPYATGGRLINTSPESAEHASIYIRIKRKAGFTSALGIAQRTLKGREQK